MYRKFCSSTIFFTAQNQTKIGKVFLIYLNAEGVFAKFPTKAIDYVGLYESFTRIASRSRSLYTNLEFSHGTSGDIATNPLLPLFFEVSKGGDL